MAGVVKPTKSEKKVITKRLKKKYPQMYKKDWIKRLKKNVKKELKSRETLRTKQYIQRLRGAGVSEKEIKKLTG